MQMKDKLASLIAFIFAEDKKEHPMPKCRQETLFQKIRFLLGRKTTDDMKEKGENDRE